MRALAARPDADVIVFGDAGCWRARRGGGRRGAGGGPRPRGHRAGARRGDAGQPNDAAGRAQLAYLQAATDAALAGEVAALVTAPISKQWIARAGFAFPGHTEYLAARAGVSEFAMMLAGPTLRVTVATTHVPLRDVRRPADRRRHRVHDLADRRRAGAALRRRGAAGRRRGAEPARGRSRPLR